MKKFKKLLAVLFTGIMVCTPATVMAKEAEPVSVERQSSVPTEQQNVVVNDVPAEQQDVSIGSGSEVEPASLGKLLALGSGTIYNGSGTFSFTLPSGNWWADFVASIGYTTSDAAVEVSILTPDGNSIYLGSMRGNGGSTASHQEAYAPAGTYKVYCLSTNKEPFDVICSIYD